MKLFKIFLMVICINQAFFQSPLDDLQVEEITDQQIKDKHKILDDSFEDAELDNKEEIGQFIIEFLAKYDPEKTGKISTKDYQSFLEEIYVNAFESGSEGDNEAMRQLIAQFIEEEKKEEFISYDEIKEDVNGPGFTNFFEKKLQENMKQQDDYLQELINDAGAELVDEKVVEDQEELEQLQRKMKSEL